ncbi:hypothetical protein SESBI_19359 [Sesbania bispinosa]|nr:hypothetical protein SESBI_19359 [Sesbania bispinosa]
MECWKDIQLNDEEEAHVVALSDPEDDSSDRRTNRQICLICKVWKIDSYNVRAFKSTMLNIWKTRGGLEIMDLGENLFSIKVFNDRDKENILRGSPWTFEKKRCDN